MSRMRYAISRMLSQFPYFNPMTIRKIHLEQTDSTNNYLRFLPPQQEDMVVVTADYQTAGRGQGSNKWESEPGENLLMSVSVKPTSVPVKEQFVLSMAGAIAVAEALDNYTQDITLKWPNDVYWRDCKISGTLIETSVGQGLLQRCIFGIGINVNQKAFRSDAPNPVSLRQILGHEIPVDEFAEIVVERLSVRLSQVMAGGTNDIIRIYHERLYRKEGIFSYEDAGGSFSASIDHVEPDGHIVLRDTTGCVRKYAFKEVVFVI